ncbi:cytosolic carboxypeptidase 2 [Corythoichthys intestinalis]|uniref:cytosolic carboxypeptidase 2 n=1 Tax=Corythoichthys intestinalis TaxID=161448 RepID=UPI0025A66E74|nr:cytosolic carboxypeptidase 2 [Corythoichthys intestinalis]XP_057693933.1 cytosolic carboxypeptidase 2 [Corythoichthys intestinalis]XP_057693934.1 cytosolic carboxypeptidase 2 [Corythoichthys intestinalis]XP_057693935.1 cytosolic carboxypeptidase 2 [Corythoichthys intestinalis]XP_057693936.1 cytosolic carboxypeptidase 2 [Corythoichthys intestinalis]XP_057693937.1 cytosolic carboxypeptidase 2 [Corythoichthys intestinalis]
MAGPVIRNWWHTYQLDKSDINDSNKEEDKDDLAEKRQLSISQTLRTRQLRVDFDGNRPVLSLRAPLDLVQFPSISGPRWPVECEVVSNAIHHIEWKPPKPEPLYHPTGHEKTPFSQADESRTLQTTQVVYCIDQGDKCPYFTCSRVGGSRISTSPNDADQKDLSLEFESRFESGNLQKAVQVGPHEYELTLRTDMYTSKHTQWFYFRVRNMKAEVSYRLTIVNLMKRRSLYSQGMKPLLYSERAAEETAVGWIRTGSNITYYRSQNSKDSDSKTLYSLTWTLQFPYESDTCYLAHCYPYTYSHLQSYLRHISSNPAVVSYCTVRVLCYSLAGNAVYVLTVTSRAGDREEESKTKRAVVVTARVHPGETNASWLMEGFLDFLLGDSDDAQLLRDTFVFKVVPMLNPDGVVVGNYRCSLAGRDLNRNYKTTLRDSFPCVWHTRNMVEKLMKQSDVILYCDFHGHNRKNNVFMYGCNNRDEDAPKLLERVFPFMLSKNVKNMFAFRSCKFQVQKSKEGTGRVAMWRLGIKNSYTMETSFGGSTLGDKKGTHLSMQDLKSLGFYFCDTLLDFCDPDPTKVTYCLREVAALLREEFRELGKDLDTDFSVFDLESGTSGSNSSDSDGPPLHLLQHPRSRTEEPSSVKNKKKMTRKERNHLKGRIRPEVVQSTIQNIEPDFPTERVNPERPLPQHKRNGQVNIPERKSVSPARNPVNGGISHVSLWEGFQEDCREDARTDVDARRKKRPGSNLLPPREQEDRSHWSYTSKLLHLSALLQRPPKLHPKAQQQLQQLHHHQLQQHQHFYTHPHLQQRYYRHNRYNLLHRQLQQQQQQQLQQQQQQPPLKQHQYFNHHLHHEQFGLDHLQDESPLLPQPLPQPQPQQHHHQQNCVPRPLPVTTPTTTSSASSQRPTFDLIPPRQHSSNMVNGHDGQRERIPYVAPNRYYAPQDQTSVPTESSNNNRWEGSSHGHFSEVALLKHLPFREINRRDLLSEICGKKPMSHPHFLMPVIRYTEPQGHRLSVLPTEDKGAKTVLPPVVKRSTSAEWQHR